MFPFQNLEQLHRSSQSGNDFYKTNVYSRKYFCCKTRDFVISNDTSTGRKIVKVLSGLITRNSEKYSKNESTSLRQCTRTCRIGLSCSNYSRTIISRMQLIYKYNIMSR